MSRPSAILATTSSIPMGEQEALEEMVPSGIEVALLLSQERCMPWQEIFETWCGCLIIPMEATAL
jgi:hypothetical protein